MNFFHHPLAVCSLIGGLALISPVPLEHSAHAGVTDYCPAPALSRMQRHVIADGETVESIAQQYNLSPATIIAMNPFLHKGIAPVHRELQIPPYNGIVVQVPPHQTWRQVATKYKLRPDTLFEINGCQRNPRVIFVPVVPAENRGVNSRVNRSITAANTDLPHKLISGYPLANKTNVALPYGWQINRGTGEVFFHSGVDLVAPVDTPVEAIAPGIVVFAKTQGTYGKLVILNHAGGFQSRYAQLNSIKVRLGEHVQTGQVIGTVGTTGNPTSSQPNLHFEIRTLGPLGWEAKDPQDYLTK
jgi:lysostaphin